MLKNSGKNIFEACGLKITWEKWVIDIKKKFDGIMSWIQFKKWKKHRAGNGRCSEMRHSPFLKFSEEKCESVKNQHSDELTDGRSSASTTVCQMWAKMSREEKKM